MVLFFKEMTLYGSISSHRKKFATLAGGCAPEASTLPPVTVSRIFFYRVESNSFGHTQNFKTVT